MIKHLTRFTVFAVLALALAASASAQLLHQRQLPASGKRGELGEPLPLPLVRIGRDVLRLAPGSVIYDATNRAVLHGGLPSQGAVLYTTDANGDIQRLYVLTPAEQAMLDARPARRP